MNTIIEKRQGVRFFAVLMRFIKARVVIDDAIPCAAPGAVEQRVNSENGCRSTALFQLRSLSSTRLHQVTSY